VAVGLRPVPRIDHIMVLLDAPAYQDLAASGFLGERFARLKRKEANSSVAGQYSTIGVAGDNTLIELFGADMPGSAPLTGGLVFSFEEPGSSSAAQALLAASGQVKFFHDLVKREVAGASEPQPWYHLLSVDLGVASPLLLLLNEVTPEYFGAIGARPAPDGTLRRKDYLDAALGAPSDGSRLMRDIVGVTVIVHADRAEHITNALAAFGFEVTRQAREVVLSGPELTVRLAIDDSVRERIADIEVRIEPGQLATLAATEYRFGETSRLVIENDDTARWIFGPAEADTAQRRPDRARGSAPGQDPVG